MMFNNIINHLKLWCNDKANIYQRAYQENKGILYVGYQLAYELEFKLLTLIDKPFESKDDFKNEVLNLIDIHYEASVLKPQNSLVNYIVDKINKEFRDFLEEILLEENLAVVNIPYERIIVGLEASELQEKFRSVWGYVNTSYWFPLMGDEPKEVPDKFFVMFDYFEPYMKQFEQIIGLPQKHIYKYGENDFRPQNCIETVEMNEYGGLEIIYTDKAFSWAVYFSHEDTVAFAGSIVPQIKELLSKEKEHWNKFEWNLE